MFVLFVVTNLEHCDTDCDIRVVGSSSIREELEEVFVKHVFENYLDNVEYNEDDFNNLNNKARSIATELMQTDDYRGSENSLFFPGWWVAQIKEI